MLRLYAFPSSVVIDYLQRNDHIGYLGLLGERIMNIQDLLYKILPGRIYPVPGDLKQRNDETVRQIARRNAEGNVLLGMGKVVTQKDIDRVYRNLGK